MMQMNTISKNIYIFAGFFIFVFFAHLLFVLNTSSYWDSSIYMHYINSSQYNLFITPWLQNGRALMGDIYWLIGHDLASLLHIKSSLILRLTTILGIILSGIFVYIILQKFMHLEKCTCLFIIMLGSVYPAYQVHLSFTTIAYVLFLPFYLASLYLALLQEKAFPSLKKILTRTLSLACLLVSFISEATIPMTFLTLILLFMYRYKNYSLSLISSSYRFILSHIDYAALSIIYLLAMTKYMKPYGAYETSRDLNLHFFHLCKVFAHHLSVGFNINYLNPFADHIFYSSRFFGLRWLDVSMIIVFFAAALIAVLYFYNIYKKHPHPQKQNQRNLTKKYWMLFLIGIMSFSISISSFVAADRAPVFEGWGLRYLTIAAFPAAIVVVSYVRLLLLLIKKHQIKYFAITTSIIILLITLTLWKSYFVWLSRSALDESLVINLQQSVSIQSRSPIIIIHKSFEPIFGEKYRPYEWTYLINRAWPKTPAIALTLPQKTTTLRDHIKKEIKLYRDKGLIDVVDKTTLHTPYVFMNIYAKNKSYHTNWMLGAKYLINKTIMSGKNLNNWLQSLTLIDIKKPHTG
jgi:hypothetical protein